MTRETIRAALPFLIAFASPFVLVAAIAVKRSFRLTAGLAVLLLGLALVSVFPAARAAPAAVPDLFRVDGFALLYAGLLFAAGLAAALLGLRPIGGLDDRREEFFALLALSVLGGAGLVASCHFASFFLSLETLSVSLYALIAYTRDRERAVEAGLKYLVLAAVSAAFLLFGIALIYFETGTLELARLGTALAGPAAPSPLVLAGFALVLLGVGFKLSLVPFHVWAPDIYQGASAPVAALVAGMSKAAVAGFLVRFFWLTGAPAWPSLRLVLGAFAAASMVFGNLLALGQPNLKRLLGYSSIAHFGYLLVAFLAAGPAGVEAVTFYLVAYSVTIVGAFGIVAVVSPRTAEAEMIDDYAGLFWTRPVTAAVFSAMLFSLAGLPLTAGFIGKFFVAAAGVGSGLVPLVVLLAANSALGLYYYLRVIVAMALPPALAASGAARESRFPAVGLAAGLALALLTLALVGLGVFPSGFMGLVRAAAETLTVPPPY